MHETAGCADLIALVEPSRGSVAHHHFAPVVAAVLAACGRPAYVLAPAHTAPGFSPRAVLEAIGMAPGPADVSDGLATLASDGVAYIEVAAPSVVELPVMGQRTTHVVAGLDASDDPAAGLLQAVMDTDVASGLFVAGCEGHMDPHIAAETDLSGFRRDGGQLVSVLQPKSYGLRLAEAPPPPTPSPEESADVWRCTLKLRKRYPASLTVRMLAGTILAHCGAASTIMSGIGLAHRALHSKRAWEVFQALDRGRS